MKTKKIMVIALSTMLIGKSVSAQDPNFSQFFSSPLNINPALTADIYGKWRVISNYRSQWFGPVEPYNTGTVSFDSKIFQNTIGNYVDEITRVGVGGMLMYDNAMGGALKSTYASFNLSGNIRLASTPGREINGFRIRHISKIKMDEAPEQRIGLGLGIIYGHKRLDPTKLTFEEQFTGYGNGFDTNLPTGEAAFSSMKPYISTSAGLVYSNTTWRTNFELGVAAFHLNRPKQSFLDDENQFLAKRYVIHSNYETTISNTFILNTNGIYQYQSGASYFSIGGALGYHLPTYYKDIMINAGLWYWSKNAITPYMGLTYGDMQFGLSYDITISKLAEAPSRPHTFELSMIFRGKGKPDGVIPAPWK